MSITRRKFLGMGAAATAGLSLAPGVRLIDMAEARAPDVPASAKNRWGLLIDTTKCAKGCSSCVDACATENGVHSERGSPETHAEWIRKVDVTDPGTGHEFSLPVMCQHCQHPPCVDVCPTGASFKRADGIVLVDKHICIGCRYCMMACPYKARSFEHENVTGQKPYAPRGKGTVESCTLCVQKIDRGDGTTACAEACKKEGHEAILFGDLNDPESEISKRVRTTATRAIREDMNLDTSVRYKGI
ncbi:MAG: 4Fe-4S dicluster domain-containing protein [Acidiferrobacteraceae bacterium]|jgi:tetrathionate reductase subunit B